MQPLCNQFWPIMQGLNASGKLGNPATLPSNGGFAPNGLPSGLAGFYPPSGVLPPGLGAPGSAWGALPAPSDDRSMPKAQVSRHETCGKCCFPCSFSCHSQLLRGHGMWSSLPVGAMTSAALSVDQLYRGFFTSAAAAGAASAGLQCPAARRAPLPTLRLPRVHRPLHRVPVQAGAPAAGM